MNRKGIIRKSLLALAALLVFTAALCAAYISGQKSGLTAPGAQVIECPAEPEAQVVGCPTEAPA